ncbi:MAG: hypothetical protein MZU91_07985 [Desulfosudis oleivorans]|nr:hypothetical protein [Desulfosudis oleivorans]
MPEAIDQQIAREKLAAMGVDDRHADRRSRRNTWRPGSWGPKVNEPKASLIGAKRRGRREGCTPPPPFLRGLKKMSAAVPGLLG